MGHLFKTLFLVVEIYGTRYRSGSFSLINVGSGFHCLHTSFFLHSQGTHPPHGTHPLTALLIDRCVAQPLPTYGVPLTNFKISLFRPRSIQAN